MMDDTTESCRDKQIVDELTSRFTCRICEDIIINGAITNCGHRFCRYCLTLALQNYTKCLECSQPVLSVQNDETTNDFIKSAFRQCSENLRKKRCRIEKNRSYSQNEMKIRLRMDLIGNATLQQVKRSDKDNKMHREGRRDLTSLQNNSKILEEKLFKTYDQLLSQISSHFPLVQAPAGGPQGDNNLSKDEQTKIESVTKQAAKTASEALMNLPEADDLLQEADDVVGIIKFLKTHSMENISKEAASFNAHIKGNVEEHFDDSDVTKEYEKLQNILTSVYGRKSQPKNYKANSKFSSAEMNKKTKHNNIEGEKATQDDICSIELSAHIKKCHEALQRIRNENFESSYDNNCQAGSRTIRSTINNSSGLKKMLPQRNQDGVTNILTSRIKINKKNTSAIPSKADAAPQLKFPPLFSSKSNDQ